MDAKKLKNILEAGLLVAGRTMSIAQLEGLFEHDDERPDRKEIREALESLKADYEGRGIELVEVASGFRLQSHESVSDWVANLFQEKTPRYSRALLETLVLIAYRQPITRAEIEDVRGVAVSSNIVKTLQERQWVKVLGHKEVPGRPALLGTTKDFLDYFNLKKLDDLPSLADVKDLDQFDALLAEEVGEVEAQGDAANDSADGGESADSANGGDSGNTNGSSDGADQSSSSTDAADQSSSSTGLDSSDDADSQEASASASEEIEGRSGEVSQTDSDDVESDDNLSKDASTQESENVSDDIEDTDGINPDETLSGPELELLRVISDFSEEHQQEIDARDEMEAGIISGNDNAEEDDMDAIGDLSQRISDEASASDRPEPGDTLH